MQNVYRLADFAATRGKAPIGPTSDEFLISAIAKGDKNAMQVLFARHNTRLYRYIVRLTGNHALAEDVVSDVFLDVWVRADRFAGRSKVSTWLLAIARYKALNALRRDRELPWDDEVAATIADPNDDPEVVVHKMDRGRIVRKCLSQLAPAHREIIDLVYYHKTPLAEVARIVGIPVGTVKTRTFYARKQLAELFRTAGLQGDPAS